MTRFDYFSDIEEKFIELRGKALILSPLDWELIQSWKDQGVPAHVVMAAIEEVFKSHAARKNRRAIGSLSYCKSEVEARFAEWQASRVGAHESAPGAVATGSNPFGKEAVRGYLETTRAELLNLSEVPDGLKIAILHVVEKLDGLILGLHVAERIDPRMMEEALNTLEAILSCAIEMVSTPEQLAEARAAAEAFFAPYKNNMLPQVYEQQIDSQLKKHLRALFGVPRLSLFHMKG